MNFLFKGYLPFKGTFLTLWHHKIPCMQSCLLLLCWHSFFNQFFPKKSSCYSTPDSFNSLTPDSWEAICLRTIFVLVSSYKFQKAKQTCSLLCLFQSLLKTHWTPPLGSDGPSFNASWAFNALLYQRRGFAYDTAGSWGGGAGSGHPRIPVPVIRGAGMWEAEPVTRRHQAEPVLLTVSKELILKDQRLALSQVAIATVFLSHSVISSVKRHCLTIHPAISPLHQTQ